MSSTEESDSPTDGGPEAKKMKSEEREEGDDDLFRYHDPKFIFQRSANDQWGLTGSNDLSLAVSFYHSRYWDSEYGKYFEDRLNYSRNAGAVQLYTKDDKPYQHKEYNCVSHPITEDTPNGWRPTPYGHSGRKLICNILDDLIRADDNIRDGKVELSCSNGELIQIAPPSDISESKDELTIYQNLTENAPGYKKYLEKKGVVVKMWSERPPCPECRTFMEAICPEGSKYGYIIKKKDLEEAKRKKEEGVVMEMLFEEFKESVHKHWKKIAASSLNV